MFMYQLEANKSAGRAGLSPLVEVDSDTSACSKWDILEINFRLADKCFHYSHKKASE